MTEIDAMIDSLRALSRYENDDLSLAADAADLIESMSNEITKLNKAIDDIAPWLSASLESAEINRMTTCAEYDAACEQIFRLDRDIP